MPHIHITLVGGQPTPVYAGILDSRADKVILVCSRQTMEEARRIQSEITIPSEIEEFDPVNLIEIESKTLVLARNVTASENKVSVNISGGTKPWTYYFAKVFREISVATVFYIDQNNRVWNFSDKTSHAVNFDMDAQFRLFGNALNDNYDTLSLYSDDDFDAINKIIKLRKHNPVDFSQLTANFSKNPEQRKFKTRNGSSLIWDEDNGEFIFRIFNKNEIVYVDILDSKNCSKLLMNTGWFEVEIASRLSQWAYTKDLRLNCKFPDKNNSPKNEVDIIVDTGNKLLFVECKTRIFSETDIDKFRSVVKNYGGLGSKAIFISDTPMSEKAKEKCKDNKILSFSIKENGGRSAFKQKLFELLEKELFNINPK